MHAQKPSLFFRLSPDFISAPYVCRGLSFQLWPAAEALCRYLESAYGHISGRLQGLRVLELGAGTGLVGIFAARLGADVILTDLPGVLENLQANVALNQRKNQGLTGTPLQSDYPAVNRNPVLTEKHGVSGELETKRIPAAQKDSARIMERILQADGKEPGEGGEATCLATVEPTERFLKPETDVGKLRPVPECTLAGSTIGLTRDAETRSHRTPCEGQGEMLTDADCGRKNGRSGSGSEMKSERRNHRELAASLSVELLSWGMKEDVDALVKRTGGFDLVLASDVVYYDTLFEPLLQTLRWLTKPGVGEVPTACSDESQSSRHEGSENHARATVKTGSNGERAAVIMQNRALEAVTGKQKVLIAHLRRWKKDAKFFRKASKYFDVRLVYSHPPVGEARKGVEVFELVAKR